jgi:hypothetical protein
MIFKGKKIVRFVTVLNNKQSEKLGKFNYIRNLVIRGGVTILGNTIQYITLRIRRAIAMKWVLATTKRCVLRLLMEKTASGCGR